MLLPPLRGKFIAFHREIPLSGTFKNPQGFGAISPPNPFPEVPLRTQYNPIGTNCGDGATPNQTCYLMPDSGPGNFGALQEISPSGLPRVLQVAARFTF